MNDEAKIVKLFGKDYAVGMFWQMLSRGDKNEIPELAKQLDFDLFSEDKTDGVHQVGFISSNEVANTKATSLALQLLHVIRKEKLSEIKSKSSSSADVQLLSFIVSLEVNLNSWYLLVVKDGVVQPDTDCICEQDRLINRLMSLLDGGGWDCVWVDDSLAGLGLSGTTLVNFANILAKQDSRARLHVIRSEKEHKLVAIKSAGIIVGVLMVIALAYYAWTKYEEKLFLEEQARIQAQKPPPPPPPPWDTQPLAKNFVNHCLQYFDPVLPGGWELQEFECLGSNISFAWTRNEGNLNSLYKANLGIIFDATSQRATKSVAIPALPGAGKHFEVNFDKLENQFFEISSNFQLIDGVQITFKPIVDAPLAEGVFHKIKQTDFEATVQDIDPRFFISMMPIGTRLRSLQNKGNNWVFKGILYGNENVSK